VAGSNILRHRLFTIVSDGWTGLTWSQPAVTYGDTLVSTNLAPALSCAREDVDRCLVILRSYATSAVRSIFQQAFELTTAEDFLHTLPSTQDTGNYAYSDLGLARIGDAYMMTWVWPTMANDKLTYRITDDAEGAPWTYPAQTWTGAMSRSGFSVAWNYRTSAIRLLWHEN
jgi:hypothetical protein